MRCFSSSLLLCRVVGCTFAHTACVLHWSLTWHFYCLPGTTVSSLSLLSFKLLDIFLALTSLFYKVSIYPYSYLIVGLYLFFYISVRDYFSFSQSTALIFFFLVHVCGWWVVSFPFALKVPILLSFSKSVFVGYRIPGWWLFVFQHFTDASPLSSDFLFLESQLSVLLCH